MRSGCNCSNCEFAEPVRHDRNKLLETIGQCEKELDENAEELSRRGMYIANVELQMKSENLLREMDTMKMCHRYPEPLKVDNTHWCGEHKRARWS